MVGECTGNTWNRMPKETGSGCSLDSLLKTGITIYSAIISQMPQNYCKNHEICTAL